MDWTERLRQRSEIIRHFKPGRIAPTVSIRKELPAAALGEDEMERLARFCRAVHRALLGDPLFGGRYDGKLKLKLLEQGPVLKVGLKGGEHWRQVEHMDAGVDLKQWRRALSGESVDPVNRVRGPAAAGLEILDMSGLAITDWRGMVASPQVGRVVLLSRLATPEGLVHPVVLDFDHKLADAGRAARFLEAVGEGLA